MTHWSSVRALGWRLLCLLALSGCDSDPALKMAWTSTEPAAEISKALALIFERDFQVETTQHATYDDLHQGLSSGALTLAVIEQPAAPVPGLTAISHLFPSVLHILVKDCPAPQNLVDLVKGRSIYPGPEGSAGHRLLLELSAAQLLPPATQMQLLASPFGADPDVLLVFGGILSSDALSRLTGYCLASLGDPSSLGKGAWVEGIAYRFPHLQPFIIPAGLYPALAQSPVLTLAVPSLLAAHEGLDEEAAYQIASLVEQHTAELEVIYPLAGNNPNNRRLAADTKLPLHPGAQRFRNRDAPTMLERYAELLALALTLIVALTSAAVAAVRLRRQARKDRLDEYFDRLLDARAQLNANNPAETRSGIIDLQTSVTRLVVDERVAADASLVAFFELSNQVLKETRALE